jgi:hypothetical protein
VNAQRSFLAAGVSAILSVAGTPITYAGTEYVALVNWDVERDVAVGLIDLDLMHQQGAKVLIPRSALATAPAKGGHMTDDEGNIYHIQNVRRNLDNWEMLCAVSQ